MLGDAVISWPSKKQTVVALSTKEAEYTAFTDASREALWLRQLLLGINFEEVGAARAWGPAALAPLPIEVLRTEVGSYSILWIGSALHQTEIWSLSAEAPAALL